MNKVDWEITVWNNTDFFFTYDEEEKQEITIAKENSKLIFQPRYFTIQSERLDDLTLIQALLFAFIDFYVVSENTRFYFTNNQLSTVCRCSERTIQESIQVLEKKWYIEIWRKVRAGWWQIRFIKPTLRLAKKYQLDWQKSTSQTSKKVPTKDNKIKDKKIKELVSKDTLADNASIAIVKEYNNGESSANNISNKDTTATDNIIPTEEIAASIYQWYVLAFPNKKWHARKLAIQRIKSLLKNYTEQQLLSAIVKYKLEKKDTIAKQEWNFIKTADTFFWFEKWTKVEFIDRYITEEINMTPKKELKKEELDFLSDDDFNF